MTDTAPKKKWKAKFPDERVEKRFNKFLKSRPDETTHYEKYIQDVMTDPYSHPQEGRIVRLKEEETYPENTLRWKKANLRVVYKPDDSTQTVWNLDIGSATSIPYKKVSRK